jgi:putative DNA primase/helicase
MTDLKSLPQWLCWKYEIRDGKETKVPYQVNGSFAKSNDCSTWNNYQDCVHAVKVMDYSGVGFVFSKDDPYIGIDIDDCISDDGIHPKALQIITHLNSYAEISPSEKGVKLWIKDGGSIADLRKKQFSIGDGMNVEVYRVNRYFTVTDNVYEDSTLEINEAGAELNEIIDMYVSKDVSMFDDGDSMQGVIQDGEETYTTEECKAYLDNQIAIAVYKIRAMKDGTKHRTRYNMGRLVGGAIQAVVNAGYEISKEQTVTIADKLFDANPPSGNDRQEYQAIRDGIRAGKDSPTRIRRLVSNMAIDIDANTEVSTELVQSIHEYFGGIHPIHSINDSDLAALFLHLFSENIKYCGVNDTWYEWKTNVWFSNKEKDKSLAITKTIEMLNALYEYGNLIPDEKDAYKYKTTVSNHKSHSRIEGVVKISQADISKQFNLDKSVKYPYYYPVTNGIIDLRNGNLLPHNKEYGFMRVIDVTYDKNADAPEWSKFIDMIFLGRKDLIKYVQTALGYSITGESGLQILFYCLGNGANGKSTLFNIIEMIGGKWYTKTDIAALTLKSRDDATELKPYIAKLRNVRVTVAPEAIAKKQLDYSLIKEITGSERLTARGMYKDIIDFDPTHTLWISGNKLPEMKQHDDGFGRRFKIIPFDYKIPEQDRMAMNIALQMYKKELSGILNWFVEGAMMLYKTNKMPECEIVERLSKSFRKDSDVYEMFLEECCNVDRNNISDYWVHKKLAWSAFYAWIKEANIYEIVNRPLFTQEMTERLEFRIGKKGKEFYLGFRIKPEYLKNIYDMDADKLNGFGRKDLDGEEPAGFKPSNIIQMPARNLPIPLDDVADDTF